MTTPIYCANERCNNLAAQRRNGYCHDCYNRGKNIQRAPGPPDMLAVTQCADGLIPYLNLRRDERTLVVHILQERGHSLDATAERLGLAQRNVVYQRSRKRPDTTPTPSLNYTPPEHDMPHHTIDEIAETAQNLCDDLAGYPDLAHVLANAELIATNEPRYAAQIMLALAAWVPVDDTITDRANRQEQLRLHRIAEGLPTLDDTPLSAAA